MRSRPATWTTCTFALFACTSAPSGSDASDSSEGASTSTSTSTTDTASTSETSTGETTDTDGGPPLSNGPAGPSFMVLGCAPNDAGAWALTIGLGSGCDMAQPDPSAAYVSILSYDYDFMSNPVGMTVEWTGGQKASAYYAPDGQNGIEVPSIAGSLHIESWDEIGVEGSTIIGWYTMSFDAGDEIGAAFEATFCGGTPMCG